ncbi:hypothetical protein C8J56DRAFT_919340 [Mycena floridula]|nr:hypothetical protein C8J56DRAFT_919340 [Mycena floridula]
MAIAQASNEIEMDSFSATSEVAVSRGKSSSSKDYATGVVLLLIVVVLWTSSNFITQDLFQGGYAKPFLVTYLNTSAFTLYLIPLVFRYYFRSKAHGSTQYQPLGEESPDRPLTTRDTARLASVFCVLWFVANWTLNTSLDYTSVASATILSSTSGFFTMAVGGVFRVERLTWTKGAAVITSFIGVILVSVSDSNGKPASETEPQKPALGDSLALVSALFYALYVVLLKVRIRSESRIDMSQFFGFVGLFSIIGTWPIALVLHFLGVEKLSWPTSSKQTGAILFNMAITWASDYIYVLAMLKTTPLVVTVGLSLTIPLAVIGDYFLGRPATASVLIGALLVLGAFIVVGRDKSNREEPELVPVSI